MLRTKVQLILLLLLVAAANYAETAIEPYMHPRQDSGLGVATNAKMAQSMSRVEGAISFENHGADSPIAIYGYSISYFLLFPLLAIGAAAALARRKDARGLRVFSLAVAFNYLIALPFFILFPVPERWTYPESGAILLSDLCTRFGPKLIELFREAGDGLDNCFPSFHVSFTVLMILIAYHFRLRFRSTVAALGTAIVASTFALGIHWLADIVAGVLTGGLSVALALRYSPVRQEVAARETPDMEIAIGAPLLS